MPPEYVYPFVARAVISPLLSEGAVQGCSGAYFGWGSQAGKVLGNCWVEETKSPSCGQRLCGCRSSQGNGCYVILSGFVGHKLIDSFNDCPADFLR
jgi:hypothetical protein